MPAPARHLTRPPPNIVEGMDRPGGDSPYTRDYYLKGHPTYAALREARIERVPLLRMLVDLTGVEPGDTFVDLGCGRGEVAIDAAGRGARAVGVDGAADAIQVAREAAALTPSVKGRVRFMVGNLGHLPLPSGRFRRAVFADVWEHLTPEGLSRTLQEAHRVLEPGGRLVIHTWPNGWYCRFGHPLETAWLRWSGSGFQIPNPAHLPGDPYHVSEPSPSSVGRLLRRSGFRARVWVKSFSPPVQGGWLRRWCHRQAYLRRPGVLVFGRHIFAVAIRP